jgi:hypothetical protein
VYLGCFNLNYEERCPSIPFGPVGGSGTLAEPCKAQSERINELGVALKLRFAPAGCSLGTSGRKV